MHVSKLYHTADAQTFRAFGRVMSGTIRQGQLVKVLGEGYSPDDEEDMVTQSIDNIWLNESRFVNGYLICRVTTPADLAVLNTDMWLRLIMHRPVTWSC